MIALGSSGMFAHNETFDTLFEVAVVVTIAVFALVVFYVLKRNGGSNDDHH